MRRPGAHTSILRVTEGIYYIDVARTRFLYHQAPKEVFDHFYSHCEAGLQKLYRQWNYYIQVLLVLKVYHHHSRWWSNGSGRIFFAFKIRDLKFSTRPVRNLLNHCSWFLCIGCRDQNRQFSPSEKGSCKFRWDFLEKFPWNKKRAKRFLISRKFRNEIRIRTSNARISDGKNFWLFSFCDGFMAHAIYYCWTTQGSRPLRFEWKHGEELDCKSA